jgi:predicted anti-sigma-YlaC factor YlaD
MNGSRGAAPRLHHWAECVDAYLDGELSATDRAAFEAHLVDCSGCRESLAGLRDLQVHLASLPEQVLGRDLTGSVLAAVDTGRRSVGPAQSLADTRRTEPVTLAGGGRLALLAQAVAAVVLAVLVARDFRADPSSFAADTTSLAADVGRLPSLLDGLQEADAAAAWRVEEWASAAAVPVDMPTAMDWGSLERDLESVPAAAWAAGALFGVLAVVVANRALLAGPRRGATAGSRS